MISETIEFCLWHERDIQLALENETGSVLHAVNYGSGLSGDGSGVKSSKVSDPTYMNALRRIEAVNCLSVPYGPLYGHSPKYNAETKLFAADRRWRENFTLHFPVKWLLVTASVKRYFLDEDNRKFMVTSASNLAAANPDVLDYSQVTGCNLDIHENKHELKTQDKDGKSVSYNPPRYEYSYSFAITIFVNHPYFDDMHFSVSNGSVKTGERSMNTGSSANNINSINMLKNKPAAQDLNEYNEYLALGNEIKAAIDSMREKTREQVSAQNAPKTAVTCPWCGATTFPDENGCCEYCGGAVGN